MYCPSCGKEIPDKSAFCLHCGKPTSSTDNSKIKYEYHDVVANFLESDMKDKFWVPTETYTAVAARLYFWQALQAVIMEHIQTQWLDEGWQPVTEIGPGMIKIDTRPAAFFGNPPNRHVCVGTFLKLRRPKKP